MPEQMHTRHVFGTPLPDAPTPTADEVRRLMREYRQAVDHVLHGEAVLQDWIIERAPDIQPGDGLTHDAQVELAMFRRDLDRAREAEQAAGRAALRAWEQAGEDHRAAYVEQQEQARNVSYRAGDGRHGP